MSLTLSRCLRDLKLQGVDLAPEEFCDALWLAGRGFMPGETRSIPSAPPEMQSPYSPPLQQPSSINEPIKSPDQIDQQKPGQPVHALSDSGDRKMRGQLLSVPAPPAIARGFEFDRALRPLRQRRQVARSQEVDEEATVAAIAESGIWQIVTRPARSRWLEIVLVVERSPTMRIWQETALDFRKLLWRACAPYSMRMFYLDWSPQKLLLHSSGGSPVSSDTPCHGSGNRLILVLSDAMSVGWLTADIPELLSRWAARQTTTLVQMLPASMWQRTALRHVSLVAADQPRAATMTAIRATDDTWPRVTVTTLEPDHLRRYARMLIGAGGESVAAYRGSRPQFGIVDRRAAERRPPFNPQALSAEEIEKIFQRFERSTSLEARNLARHLASAPLILPVMRLVQRVLVPDAAPAQLAEIFLSGILYRRQPATDHEVPPNQVEYEFLPGIRNRLLDLGGLDCSFETIGLLSRYFEERFGKGGAFTALLADPSAAAREWRIAASDAGNEPFARIAGLLMDRLGLVSDSHEVVSAGDSTLDLHSPSHVPDTADDHEPASPQYDAVAEIHFLSYSDEKIASRVRAGVEEIRETLELIPSVRSPVELVQQISKLFNTAIHHGAPIWNDGSHIGCCELYHFAASQLLTTISQTGEPASEIVQTFLDDLLDALHESPTLTNAKAKCWELRHRFDRFNAIVGMEELTALESARSRRAMPVSADDIREMGQIAMAHGKDLYQVQDWLGCALLYSFCAQQIVALAQIKPLNREVQLLVRPVIGLLATYPDVPVTNELAERCAWDFYDAFLDIVRSDREPSAPQYDAVISYRREGGSYLARAIHQAIKDRGNQTFLDVDELNSGEYPEALRNVTANSPSLILLLTHGALDRCCTDTDDWVRQQILHAREHGKNIIPVTAPNFRFPELPPELDFLRDLQSVPVSDDFFEEMIDELIRLMGDARRLQGARSVRSDSLPAMQSIWRTAESIGQESVQAPSQYDAVISFNGGWEMARAIQQALEGRGKRTLLHIGPLQYMDTLGEIRRRIENAATLILLLTHDALDHCSASESDWGRASDEVRCGILHARKHDKTIVPVIAPDFQFPQLLPEFEFLRDLQGVPYSDDFFEAMIERVIRLMGNALPPLSGLPKKSRIEKSFPGVRTLFISYSHEDEAWKDRLQKQLAFLKIRMTSWHDRNISGGDDWEDQIREAMDQANLAVLLVTPEFLGSDFISTVEVPRLLERHRAGELILYPIIVSHCAWRRVEWLEELQCRPKDGQPLVTFYAKSVESCNEQLAMIADEIAVLLEGTQGEPDGADEMLHALDEVEKKSSRNEEWQLALNKLIEFQHGANLTWSTIADHFGVRLNDAASAFWSQGENVSGSLVEETADLLNVSTSDLVIGDFDVRGPFLSVYLSYGDSDEPIARIFNNCLRDNGVDVYFFPDNAMPGEKVYREMAQGILRYDRVLFLCSRHSLDRPGVITEIEHVLAREANSGVTGLIIPVTLDDYVFSEWAPNQSDIAKQIRSRVIADFRNCEIPSAEFVSRFQQIVETLKRKPKSGLISITCAKCGKMFTVAPRHAGKQGRCPVEECRFPYTIPTLDPPPLKAPKRKPMSLAAAATPVAAACSVFISHATHDKAPAEAICAFLEAEGIRCWIAPRDVLPGASYAAEVLRGISESQVMLLVLSSHSNNSRHVENEIERALSKGLGVIPVRIEDVRPSEVLELFLGDRHSFDAWPPPLEPHFPRLARAIKRFISGPVK